MKKTIVVFVCLFPLLASGQSQPYSQSSFQFKSLIDSPTAGVYQRGNYDFDIRIFHSGGILGGFTVGLFNRFNLGVYYGGIGIIGSDSSIDWNEFPGVLAKYRLFEESVYFPALALGYSSQGYGEFAQNDSTGEKRYRIKSPGLFAVLSKNYLMFDNHQFGIHFGINKNTFETDDDKDFNLFTGFDFGLNEELFILGEYNFALDDNKENKALGEGIGYFNMGLCWTFADQFTIQFQFKDIFANNRDTKTVEREIRIVYVESL